MKKSRFLCLFLTLILIISLCTPFADAYQSDIVDSMSVEAKAALLIDMDTDYVMFDYNADQKVYPASITKVVTAMLVLEAIHNGDLSLQDQITAGPTAWQGLDKTSSNQNIQVGETMSVEDLLYCLMVASANEAANILAVAVAGSIEDFVDLMNAKAEALGCTATHFNNPDGMPDNNHYTTCNDLYLIAKAAMQDSTFRTIVNTAEYYVEPTNMTESRRHFFNTNGLLSNKKYNGYYYEYCNGIKTGSTDEAGYCLMSSAQYHGQTLICIMMGCENPTGDSGEVQRLQFSQSSMLFEWGFRNFSVHTILDATAPVAEVPVKLSSECDYVSVIINGTLEAQLPNDITAENFTWTTNLPDSIDAPVSAGDKIGTLDVSLDGEIYGTVDLIAVNDVSRSDVLYAKSLVINFLQTWKYLLCTAAILILILIIFIRIKISRRRRNRYSRKNRGPLYSYKGRK